LTSDPAHRFADPLALAQAAMQVGHAPMPAPPAAVPVRPRPAREPEPVTAVRSPQAPATAAWPTVPPSGGTEPGVGSQGRGKPLLVGGLVLLVLAAAAGAAHIVGVPGWAPAVAAPSAGTPVTAGPA